MYCPRSASQDLTPNLEVHFTIIHTWYIRASSEFKLKTLLTLLKKIKTTESLVMILHTLCAASGKSTVYSEAQYFPTSIFDKPLADHNRAMDEYSLEEELKSALQWFQILNDQDQLTIIVGLMRISGGEVIRKMYSEAVNEYHEKLKIEISERDLMSIHSLELSHAEIINDSTTSNEYDPENSFSKEVARLQKIWDDDLAKYEADINSEKEKVFNVQPKSKVSIKSANKKDKNNKKEKEKKKEPKKSSAKKDSKNGKKKGKKQKEKPGDDEMDQLQMLPIWITKYIFSMLDKKTLEIAKEVNSYWELAIESLNEERKASQKINKLVEQWEKDIKILEGEISIEIPEIKVDPKPVLPLADQRFVKLFSRGAINPKLRLINNTNQVFNHSIYKEAVYESPMLYPNTLQSIKVFPRLYNTRESFSVGNKITPTVINEPYYNPILKAKDKLENIRKFGKDQIMQHLCCEKTEK